MTHGWPGSIIEQLKIIDPLTNPTAHGGSASDAFHLVIPSLPGYGFSGKPAETGWDPARIGRATEITSEDRDALRRAVESLEHPSLAAPLTNIVGKPVELIGYALPSFASTAITSATSKGLESALKVALRTLPPSLRSNSQLLHRALATASGAAGGTFGLAALPVELPVSTVIMLRSIADIARSEGEDLSDPEAALSCVEVFALGGRAGSADASESGYFAVRSMLAKTVTEAARFVAERGVIKEGAPILLKFVTQVAARFGLVVTQR